MKEKKTPSVPDREQLFGGGYYIIKRGCLLWAMNHLFIEDSGNDSDSPFQVTKGNKISAKTAISRSLKAFALIARTASFYRL
jgi:hypothetical protein